MGLIEQFFPVMDNGKPTGKEWGFSIPDHEYESLPDAVKSCVTQKEFRWMGAEGRRRLMQDFTEPDYDE